MDGAREQHKAATLAADKASARTMESLAVSLERLDNAFQMIRLAAGNTDVQTGRDALHFTAGARERIEEAMRMIDNARTQLRLYGAGF